MALYRFLLLDQPLGRYLLFHFQYYLTICRLKSKSNVGLLLVAGRFLVEQGAVRAELLLVAVGQMFLARLADRKPIPERLVGRGSRRSLT